MKGLLQSLIRRRNPQFAWDESISNAMIFQLCFDKLVDLFRGLKILFRGRIPRFLMLGRGVRFFHFRKIRIGRFVKLGDFVYLSALAKDGIYLGDNVSLGAYSRLVVSTSFNNIGSGIYLGRSVGIGEFAYLGGAGGIEIGDECIVGQYFSCHAENHNYDDKKTSIRFQGVHRQGIKIGSNCWIGSKVTILDGVEIGSGSIIAAGAVVNKSFPRNSIIGGVPAKLLKTR